MLLVIESVIVFRINTVKKNDNLQKIIYDVFKE